MPRSQCWRLASASPARCCGRDLNGVARARLPFWLGQPGRYAGLSRTRAIGVAIVLLALVAVLALMPTPEGVASFADASIHESVIDGVRAGGGYYELLADALRAGGEPLRPFLAFRLPSHAAVQALLPREAAVVALYLLAAGVAAAWWVRLAEALPRAAPRASAMILLAGGMVSYLLADLSGAHELWAGLLVALSLALRRPGRWVEAAALALIAALVRETAALYLILMAVIAFAEGARREAAGWGVALGVFALALGVHAYAVAQVTGPLDPQGVSNSLLGPGVVTSGVIEATVLRMLPAPLAALIAALALVGWSGWRDPLGTRVTATLAAYALGAALLAQAGGFYWVLLIAPLWLVGLVFLPDAVRDLAVAILDRPRVRVQRITQ